MSSSSYTQIAFGEREREVRSPDREFKAVIVSSHLRLKLEDTNMGAVEEDEVTSTVEKCIHIV